MSNNGSLPAKQGLYDPQNEHDACGVGFVCNFKGLKSHDILRKGLSILERLTHRGAVGADPLAGDGAGILIQMPDRFLRSVCAEINIELPNEGEYGVGMVLFPPDDTLANKYQSLYNELIEQEKQSLLGWRDVPVDNSGLGESVKINEPQIKMVFVSRGENCPDQDSFERKLFVIRKQIENKIREDNDSENSCFCIPSFSSRTLLYKGMLLASQVGNYYLDLHDERIETALALVHQRFSTNTFPTWELAQPFRMIAHNGEINTLRGNVNWMAARKTTLASRYFKEDMAKLWPLIAEGQSDSASFDNAIELLVLGGYSLAHAAMMMIPEAWAGNPLLDKKLRAFYEYHAALMEPWDGPAAMAFTDGRQIGATLDRNGLRPARYLITDDDLVIMASEMGVLDIPEEKIIKKWRLQPGKMFLIDLEQGRIIDDTEIKEQLSNAKPYQDWLDQTQICLECLPDEVTPMQPDNETLFEMQKGFGYTQEDIKFFLIPMSVNGQDPIGSMGIDTPIAVLSQHSKPLYNYFKQRFAQVTNPPIDPIREELVMSLTSLIGPRPNLLCRDEGGNHMRFEVKQPIVTNQDIEKIRNIASNTNGAFRSITIDFCYPAEQGASGMKQAIERICYDAEAAITDNNNIIILSDRSMDADHIAIPALLATSAVHHHLINKGLRTEVGLVIETGEAREVHHFCALSGYGAEAINPYLALHTLYSLRPHLPEKLSKNDVTTRYIKAVNKGILKVMSKMGISTYQSYCGSQVFDAVGLSQSIVDQYFTGTATTIEGADLTAISEETFKRHHRAYSNDMVLTNNLDTGGDHAYRIRGEDHIWRPETITKLQHAVRSNDPERYREFTELVNAEDTKKLNIRNLFKIKWAEIPVPIDEVESVTDIIKRFATGAMSFGSISYEAHTTLAIAMNRMGGKSNTGEGGEERERYAPIENGDSMRSAIKQVASGRFGVTTEYLINADDIQIKMAQGAKPGEGGQLPGHKVDKVIARVRHSTPGVGLISPPPHHDIYSIEDLAQLIFDLKSVNPKARISVKLVSEVGVGTVAAGVSKAHADHVTISGYDGGTGASPVTSIKHAGSPWEIGLAETHQTLVLNKLRGRIAVQVDGGLRTGRDVIIGALLGADEFGFATGPLIAEGCIMMRKCHLNTCPVGVATQDPELRKRFTGKPEHIINYFHFIAKEVRQIMAKLGFRTMNEMIGQSNRLDMNPAIEHYKAKGLDYSKLLYQPEVDANVAIYNSERQDHELEKSIDHQWIKQAKSAIDDKQPVKINTVIHNYNRTAGAMLSGEVAKTYGNEGLPDDTIHIKAIGTAGQSFGAFLAKGVTLELEGDGNDYVGKGLSGGRIIIYPPTSSPLIAEQNIIAGNTVLYGATDGECFLRGVGGERFAVRNSGAIAVIEGAGDHCCEYMTGGVVVVLGDTGRNFAAGMSGGIAYVLDENHNFEIRCNLSMVELEPITDEDDAIEIHDHQGGDLETHGLVKFLHDMTRYDAIRLKTLIEKHHHYTNSGRAKIILDQWEQYLPKFVKVMPVDYRKALQQAKKQQSIRAEKQSL